MLIFAKPRLQKAALVTLLGCLYLAPGHAAEDTSNLFLQGQISLPVQSASMVGEADRLIIKIYHPGSDGVDKDPKYTFRSVSDLPTDFRIAPPIDMNGNARWPTFIVEAFTDNDGDVLTLGPGELFATTGDPLPLGTEGIELKLAPPAD